MTALLRHRIHVAGGRYEHIFASGCENTFAEYSRGCPRRLNLLADRVLLAGYANGMRPIVPALVEMKAKDMLVSENPVYLPKRMAKVS